jgi:hypothetical protein
VTQRSVLVGSCQLQQDARLLVMAPEVRSTFRLAREVEKVQAALLTPLQQPVRLRVQCPLKVALHRAGPPERLTLSVVTHLLRPPVTLFSRLAVDKLPVEAPFPSEVVRLAVQLPVLDRLTF